jgi:hypothetical protein
MANLLPHRNKNGGEKARGLPHHGMGRHGGQDAVVASGSDRARVKHSTATNRQLHAVPGGRRRA